MRQLLVLLILNSIFASSAFALESQYNTLNAPQSIFDLVHYQEVQTISLKVDMEALLSDRRSTEKHKGVFTFKDKQGVIQNWDMKIRLRGNFRRTTCTTPPMKVSFKKKELAAAGLTRHNDFKLVTQCVEDEQEAKKLLLKEFLAYKIYNQLTDYSYRVQFVKVYFIDQFTNEVTKQWAFIIEDTAQLRSRFEANKYERKFGISKDSLNLKQEKIASLFQYMIGNLDWDLYEKGHNVKFIERDGKLFPIPYDFDFSFFVHAPYMRVSKDYNIKSKYDRVYLGNPDGLKSIDETLYLFINKKDDIYDLVNNFKELSKKERKGIIAYLDSFYDKIDDIHTPESVTIANRS